MKFIALMGLLCGASALHLTQHSPVPVANQLVQTTRMDDIELTPEQEAEVVQWAESELKDGGTITKQEAWDALMAFCEKHGLRKPNNWEKKWLEKQFD